MSGWKSARGEALALWASATRAVIICLRPSEVGLASTSGPLDAERTGLAGVGGTPRGMKEDSSLRVTHSMPSLSPGLSGERRAGQGQLRRGGRVVITHPIETTPLATAISRYSFQVLAPT